MKIEVATGEGLVQGKPGGGFPVYCWGCREEVPSQARLWVQDVPTSVRGFYCPRCAESVRAKHTRRCPLCRRPFKLRYVHMACCDTCRPLDRSREFQRVEVQLQRAREKGLPATLTLKDWLATLDYFHGLCAYCGELPGETMDHVVAVSRGGGTTVENCVPACLPCNLRLRSDKTKLEPIRRFWHHLAQVN